MKHLGERRPLIWVEGKALSNHCCNMWGQEVCWKVWSLLSHDLRRIFRESVGFGMDRRQSNARPWPRCVRPAGLPKSSVSKCVICRKFWVRAHADISIGETSLRFRSKEKYCHIVAAAEAQGLLGILDSLCQNLHRQSWRVRAVRESRKRSREKKTRYNMSMFYTGFHITASHQPAQAGSI